MATPLNTFTVRGSTEIAERIRTSINVGLRRRKVPAPNLTPGSDWWVLADAVASQLVSVEANCAIKADELMPDTATGNALGRIAAVFGLTKQPASGSVGTVVFATASTTSVATGAELVDGNGQKYAVLTGGTYADGDLIPVVAVLPRGATEGKQTNLPEGDPLRWKTRPITAQEKALVGPGGLTNGVDQEDDEALRERLFAFLQTPPKTGNAAHVAAIAESSSPSVDKSFVFPGPQGAGTVHVAVTSPPTRTNKSRVVRSPVLNGRVIPYVKGQLPEHTESTVTTVTDVNADVSFGLTLPEAGTANPPGPGGGWLDGSPWPSVDAVTVFRCTVTAVTSSVTFTVDAVTEPIDEVSQICWYSPTEQKLYQATVTSHTGSTGAYVITVNSPFVGIATGEYLWPACQNAQTYVDAVLGAFALMGPGEKTSNGSLLVRSFRHPRPSASWPYSLGGHITRAISSADPNTVESSVFFHRTDGTTTTTGNGGVLNPQVPASITSPPNILIPRKLAFYRIP